MRIEGAAGLKCWLAVQGSLVGALFGVRVTIPFPDQLRDQLVEFSTGLRGKEVSFGIDDKDGRDRADSPGLRELALPGFTLVVLRPTDPSLVHECLQLVQPFPRSVQTNAD